MPKEPFVPVLYAATFENIFTILWLLAGQCSDGKFFPFCESILLLRCIFFEISCAKQIQN